MAAIQASGNLVAFPRADLRYALGTAMKRHRLPEELAQALVREASTFPDLSIEQALTSVLAKRLICAPLDLEKARGILLVGPSGAGKSAVAAKILRAGAFIGRQTEYARADSGLALFRTKSHHAEALTVMEADGFNPLNVRAASAFAALGAIEGVQTIGVISALNDAEDVGDMVSAFRFRRVILTCLDRTRRLGAVLAASLTGAELAHVTFGPRPEDALEVLTADTLARQLLEITAH